MGKNKNKKNKVNLINDDEYSHDTSYNFKKDKEQKR